MELNMTENQIKGYKYECQIRDHLNVGNSTAYLWKDIALKTLLSVNLCTDLNIVRKFLVAKRKGIVIDENTNSFMDVGVDILQVEDGKYTFVQCKNGYKNGVTMRDLGGFFSQIGCSPDLKGAIYFTDKLGNIVLDTIERIGQANVSRTNKIEIECHKVPFIENEVKVEQIVAKPIVKQTVKFVLRDYQQKAVTDLTNHLKTNDRCILSFPCGVGKTIVSYNVALNYKYVFIVSPYKSYAEQNLNRFKEYGNNNKKFEHILIDSDGIRDANVIFEKAKLRERIIMSSTFDSVDVVNEVIKLIGGNYIVIIDEFHNLSKNDIGLGDSAEQNEMNKLITTSKKTLYVSATPRLFDGSEKIFGKVVATMSFREAITNKHITDYKICIPSVGENYDTLFKAVKDEINIDVIGNDYFAKAMFLMKGMLFNGNKKCIVYVRFGEEIPKFEDAFRKLDDYYGLNLNYFTIVAKTKKRSELLKQFSDDSGYSIMFSIRTLDECIDLPKVDSIYITYETQVVVRNLQRVFRCNRIDKDNKNKVGMVYVWCNEYSDILDVFVSMKEFDGGFTEKVEVMNFQLGTRGECNSVKMKENMKELVEEHFVDVVEYTTGWYEKRLEKIGKYIDEHGRLPLDGDKNFSVNSIHRWVKIQRNRHKNNEMFIHEIEPWSRFAEKYEEHIMGFEEIWHKKLHLLGEYFKNNDSRPTAHAEDEHKRMLGQWLNSQKINYKNNLYIMKNNDIRQKWQTFVEQHKKFFLNDVEIWFEHLDFVETCIKQTGYRPKSSSKLEKMRQSCSWISQQIGNYKKNRGIMRTEHIRKTWEGFVKLNEHLFLDDETRWTIKLNLVDKFIIENDDRPTIYANDEDVKVLGVWLNNQIAYYRHKRKAMKNDDLRKLWEQFIEKHKLTLPIPYNDTLLLKQNVKIQM